MSTNTDAARLSTIHSRADLEQVLKPGMTTNAVLARLGPCSNVMTFPDGTLLWTYWLEPFPEESGLYVLAARLSITNGRVGNLGYLRATETMAGTEEIVSNGVQELPSGSGERFSLTLSIVSSNRIDGTRFIDSRTFPNLGYVSTTPEVSIARLRTVVIERHSPAEHNHDEFPGWSFIVYLTEKDSLLLQSFTRTNVSRRIVISVNGEAVAAPVLLSPIDTGSFVIDCADRKVAERLRQELTRMAGEE